MPISQTFSTKEVTVTIPSLQVSSRAHFLPSYPIWIVKVFCHFSSTTSISCHKLHLHGSRCLYFVDSMAMARYHLMRRNQFVRMPSQFVLFLLAHCSCCLRYISFLTLLMQWVIVDLLPHLRIYQKVQNLRHLSSWMVEVVDQ